MKTGHQRQAEIEAMMPGWKVLAGPFEVQHRMHSVACEAKLHCQRVLRDQQRAGIEAKIVMGRDGAWVLRTIEGWVNTDDERRYVNRRAPADAPFGCPMCGKGMRSVQGLKIHRCWKLPAQQTSTGSYHGRLSAEQIQQAVKLAKEGAAAV